MNIESVRSLKAELSESVVHQLLNDEPTVRSFSLAARPMRVVAAPNAGIALGVAKGGRRGDYRLAVRVQRRSLEALPGLAERFRAQAKGEVDVQYIGRIAKRPGPWYQTRQRPVLIGSSIGHFRITAGTLGVIVRHEKTRKSVLLSNNHVLADEDRGKVGDAILQPGAYDGGKQPNDVIGTLLDFVKLKDRNNLVDAAIASIADGVDVDVKTLKDVGQVAGLRDEPIEPGDTVLKLGRTTGLTQGRVTAIEVDDIVVAYDRGDLSFDRQIEIEGAADLPFSQGGDSGSLIVDEQFRGCALLFAGGDTGGTNGKGLTFANDLATVFQQLNISMAP